MPGAERCQIGGQALWQHRENTGRGVDRSRVGAGVRINRRVFGNEGIHVGNGNPQSHGALWQYFAGGELVQVHGVVVVDRAPQQRGQVLHVWRLCLCSPHNRSQLAQNERRELRLQTPLLHGTDSNANQVCAVVVWERHAPTIQPGAGAANPLGHGVLRADIYRCFRALALAETAQAAIELIVFWGAKPACRWR